MADIQIERKTEILTEKEREPRIPAMQPAQKPSLLSNILAVVGIIILVVIIIWGLVHLASLSHSWFSSLFARSAPGIEVQAPSGATSGQSFTVSWSYAPSSSGSYAFLYQCESNLTLSTGGAVIPCGTSYALAASSTSLALTPTLFGTANVTAPLTIVYVPTTGAGAQGEASVVVSPAKQAASTPPASSASSAKPKATGPADLAVRIISVSADQYGNGVAVFDIANQGSGYSGGYYFQAQLPTNAYGQQYYGAPQQGTYTYTSPSQMSLGPGDHVTSTLRFTQAVSGGVFSVTVDPSSTVNDPDRTNNYAYQLLSYGAPYVY